MLQGGHSNHLYYHHPAPPPQPFRIPPPHRPIAQPHTIALSNDSEPSSLLSSFCKFCIYYLLRANMRVSPLTQKKYGEQCVICWTFRAQSWDAEMRSAHILSITVRICVSNPTFAKTVSWSTMPYRGGNQDHRQYVSWSYLTKAAWNEKVLSSPMYWDTHIINQRNL